MGALRRASPQLAALAVILFCDWLAFPGFFDIRIQDGRLFGSLVDVFNRGAPVAILAVGMTMVIASRGVDLSVGAVTAMSGAVAATMTATAVIGGTLLTGGTGLVAGTFIGVVIQGIIQTYIVFDGTLSSWWTNIVVGSSALTFHRATARSGAAFDAQNRDARKSAGLSLKTVRPRRSRAFHSRMAHPASVEML